MSPTNRNFVMAYIVLVGLPLLGLVGVLRNGRTLSAPVSVEGRWTFQADPRQPVYQPCLQALISLPNPGMTISQSGKSLVVSLHDPARLTGSGIIEGSTIHASLLPPRGVANGTDCSGEQALSFAAAIDPKTDPKSLAGTLSVSLCSSCAPLPFHATRASRPMPREPH